MLTAAGYPVNTDFGGHGVGSTMHQDPHLPNAGRPGRGYVLRPGLLLAIEPWVMADTATLVTDRDGWTLRSATGRARTASTPWRSPTTGRSSSRRSCPRARASLDTGPVDFGEMQTQARAVRAAYAAREAERFGRSWSTRS